MFEPIKLVFALLAALLILAIATAIAAVRALPESQIRRFLWSDIYKADQQSCRPETAKPRC
ncbi:MAG: hypothetical protein Q8N89_02645 [Azonexus sp.]|nr:hypothetical protein [Azonexus sp.]